LVASISIFEPNRCPRPVPAALSSGRLGPVRRQAHRATAHSTWAWRRRGPVP
jgi:hypothetical protein